MGGPSPIATIGSSTSHGNPLSSTSGGSQDVHIGGQPAWLTNRDFFSCPLSDGPKPHVGGTSSPGSSTVLINNFPAAKVGDMITEAGAPNTIISGVNSVLVGG